MRVGGLDPEARLTAAVTAINQTHPALDAVILLGDLAESGDPEAYQLLARILDGLDAPVHPMMGNHDNREAARRVFPSLADDGNGFVQFTLALPGATCVCLDTLRPGKTSGELCEQRLDWLDRVLGQAQPEAPVFLFQHHPPFRTGIACMDRIALENPEAEWEVLSAHKLPAQLFVAHVHRPVSGNWRGIPVHAQRGTNHQIGWDVDAARGDRSPFTREGPEYALVCAEPDQLIILTRNFEDTDLAIVR